MLEEYYVRERWNLNSVILSQDWSDSHKKRPNAEIDDGPLKLSSRGDWTPLELFVAGVRGCEVGMRRILIEDSNAGRP